MQFKFTEGNYDGAFRFGGNLTITAHGAQEVESLIQHFRLFNDMSDISVLNLRIEALQNETLSHVLQSDKRPMYQVSGALDYEFTAPYKTWALKNFGYDGVFPNLEIPRKWYGLIHTNYQSHLYTEDEYICFESFTSSEPWAGKDAQEYATSKVTDYIAEEFGTRRHEPEFIGAGNGLMRPNPNYLKRHRATPMASNDRLKRAFFAWWLENCANDAQKTIVQGNREIAKGASYMDSFKFDRFESVIYYGRKIGSDGKTQEYESISFADFAAMSKES